MSRVESIQFDKLRKTITPRLWSTLSHRKKQEVKSLYKNGELYMRLFTDINGIRELA